MFSRNPEQRMVMYFDALLRASYGLPRLISPAGGVETPCQCTNPRVGITDQSYIGRLRESRGNNLLSRNQMGILLKVQAQCELKPDQTPNPPNVMSHVVDAVVCT